MRLETDVCIIGAGAAGGIIALELARRGIHVTVLESGPRHDFSKRFEYARKFLKGENPWLSPIPGLDKHTTAGNFTYNLDWQRVRGVGGSTLHWEGYTLRFHADDFRLRSLHGIARDWPISYQDLEPYYAKAEAALGVAGSSDDPWASPRSAPFPLPAFAHSYSDQFFSKACASLKVGFHKLPQARNSIPYGDRSQCMACGTCHVCPTGAKASTELTHLREAEATGKVQVITDVSVLQLETNGSKITTAIYAGRDRKQLRLQANTFILTAGAIENARLLLLSRSPAFPNGLANGSGAVGKYFMSHPVIDITGKVSEEVYPYRIGFSTGTSRQFSTPTQRTTEGAFLLEFLNSAGLAPQWLALFSGKTGPALKKHVQQEFGHTLGIRVFCEQLPTAANSVSLDSTVEDYFGKSVPHITYDVGPYERNTLELGKRTAGKILEQLGASEIQSSRIFYAAHQIGTHRMGDDPGSSVVNSDLQAHEIANLYLVGSGCFPTATCFPPTLTIAALAIRAAETIASRHRAKA